MHDPSDPKGNGWLYPELSTLNFPSNGTIIEPLNYEEADLQFRVTLEKSMRDVREPGQRHISGDE